MIIYNAKIFTCNSKHDIIENGYIKIKDGIISSVKKGMPEKVSKNDYDANGMSIYPGFIDAHTHLGLTTSGVGYEGEDLNEAVDACTPHLRIIDAINPIDHCFELARKAGITTVLVSPGSANPVAGQIYAIKTVGRRIDKMSMGAVGMKFSLGENPKMNYNDRDESPVTRMAVCAVIREALYTAKRYNEDKKKAEKNGDDMPDFDIRSESLIPVLEKKLKAHFHCHRADDIFTAIRIAKEFDLDYTLVHCTDGYLIAEELEDDKCSCVIGPVICDRCKPEMASLSPENAAILSSHGLQVAICTDHSEVPIEYLPLSVGICMKNGLSFEKALDSVTSSAAKIGGIYDKTGSLEKGKSADLVMFGSNPFEVMSEPALVMSEGKVIVSANSEEE